MNNIDTLINILLAHLNEILKEARLPMIPTFLPPLVDLGEMESVSG